MMVEGKVMVKRVLLRRNPRKNVTVLLVNHHGRAGSERPATAAGDSILVLEAPGNRLD
jgi:hypothetical protein